MKSKTMLKSIHKFLRENASGILTGMGITGMGFTVVTAVRVTPKAYSKIKEAEEKKEEKLTRTEIVRETWKYYIPVVATGTASAACLIGANSIHVKRNAALSAAYTLLASSAQDYEKKVVEMIGEKKDTEIRDAIAKEKIEKNPVSKNSNRITDTGKGTTLCYDCHSGRYFLSSVEELKRVQNDMNYVLLNETEVSLNELYYTIGLDGVKLGNRIGWHVDHGLIEMRFSTQLSDWNEPCVVLDYAVEPRVLY